MTQIEREKELLFYIYKNPKWIIVTKDIAFQNFELVNYLKMYYEINDTYKNDKLNISLYLCKH